MSSSVLEGHLQGHKGITYCWPTMKLQISIDLWPTWLKLISSTAGLLSNNSILAFYDLYRYFSRPKMGSELESEKWIGKKIERWNGKWIGQWIGKRGGKWICS